MRRRHTSPGARQKPNASSMSWTTKPPGTPPVHQGSTPRSVEGRVVKIDQKQGRVTIQATDGSTHEFQASQETLQDLKVGDRIEARLRQ